MQDQDKAKWAAAKGALQFVKDGMRIGLGTGSTADKFVRLLADKVKEENLHVECVATSKATAALAQELGLPGEYENPTLLRLDMTVDGADEADEAGNLIKGGGGALLREKLVALAGNELTIIVDDAKRVKVLGRKFKLPVEIIPFGHLRTMKRIQKLGCELGVRERDGRTFVTDNGNYIVDCDFGGIADPGKLAQELKSLPGVVESGIFSGFIKRIVTGHADGSFDIQEF